MLWERIARWNATQPFLDKTVHQGGRSIEQTLHAIEDAVNKTFGTDDISFTDDDGVE